MVEGEGIKPRVVADDTFQMSEFKFKCSISGVIILATEECLSGLRCGLGKLVCGNAP